MDQDLVALAHRLAQRLVALEPTLEVAEPDPTVAVRVLMERDDDGSPVVGGLVVTLRGVKQPATGLPDLTPPTTSVLLAQSTGMAEGRIASQVLLNYSHGWTTTQQLSWFRVDAGIVELTTTTSALRPPEPGQVDRLVHAVGTGLA